MWRIWRSLVYFVNRVACRVNRVAYFVDHVVSVYNSTADRALFCGDRVARSALCISRVLCSYAEGCVLFWGSRHTLGDRVTFWEIV